MSATIVRLLLSVVALVGAPLVYGIAFGVLERKRDEATALVYAGILAAALFVPAWVLIWRPQVAWNNRRIAGTIGVLVCSVLNALIVGALVVAALRRTHYIGALPILIGTATAYFVFLVGTLLLWRETSSERARRLERLGIRAIACPKCGYNLTGLKQSVCPECGASYTLDQLFASVAEAKGTLPEEARR